MGDDIFGGGMNSGGLNPGMNSDLAKQMSLLSAAGRLRATSAGGQQQQPQRPMGMAPPVPPNVPDKQRAQFLGMMTQVLMHKNVALPPFITGQPNPAWNPEAGPLKHVQPATDNRLGALRLPGATPGRPGDIDLFKLWGAVTGAGGMQRISSAGQWENVAAHIGLQLPPALPGSHPPATQLAQLYYMLLSPLEEHMKQRTAQAKQAQAQAQMQALAAQQQQTPGQAHPQPLLTPAQMHQQQNPQANLGMQNPALGMQNPLGMQTMQNQLGMQNPMMQNNLGIQNMQPMMQNNMGMQNGLGMQTSLGMNAMNALNPVQMTPAQMHQQQQGQGAMLTPAQMHAMQNGTGAAAGAGGMAPAVNGMPGGVGGMAAPTAGPGGAMPPPAPVLPDPMGLGIASAKRKSEPDEDEKRAKLKVADPAVAAVTPTVPAAPSNRRHKIEYVPLRLDVETFGGRALDGMMANVGVQGSMERPMRDISELGIVDIPSLTLSLRARTPRSLGYALGTLSVLSTHSQQTFPLVRCEDLVDTLIELLEAAIWDGEDWTGGKLGHSEEVKPPINELPVKNETDESMQEDIPDDEVPIRTHRELVRIAAEQGAGMRIRGRGWDGGSIEQSMKHGGTSLDPDLAEMYGDIAPPGLIRSDVILTIVRLLRNFSMGAENCAFMAREGSRLVDVLAGMVGFREGPEDEDPIGFINGSWDGGVHVSITPLSSALNLSQLLRVRKDVLHIVSNLAMHIRLNALSSTPAQLFSLIASFLLDPADTRSPIQLYQTLLPHRRFSLTTDLALDAISRLAHLDANRAVLQRTVPPVQLRATFNALIRMLPAEANDMGLIMRSEPWMAYTERLALAVYALACSLPITVRRLIRTQRAMGASVLRMMCRMAQYDPATGGEKGGWSQRSPFSCLVRRVIEALRMIDEEEGSAEVIGWPVRGAKVEGDKGAGWLAGVGAEDALIMMVIEGMDPVTFEDLDVLTRVGEVAA